MKRCFRYSMFMSFCLMLFAGCGGGSGGGSTSTCLETPTCTTLCGATGYSSDSGAHCYSDSACKSACSVSCVQNSACTTLCGATAYSNDSGATCYSDSACSSSCGVVSCHSSRRQFTVTNNTGEDIWVGVTAGTISCLSDADCPTAASGSCVGAGSSAAGVCDCTGGASQCGSVSTCSTSNNHCYWNLPTLSASQMHLANGGSSSICFPAPVSTFDMQWSGNIFARTGCDSNGQNCKTGDCAASSSGICPTGSGGNPPAALFEFTLSNQSSFTPAPSPDYYDVSIINGINVAVSGGPVAGTYAAEAGNVYSCATPGGTPASGSTLTACSWTVTPTVSSIDQSSWLRDVSPTSYTAGSTCPGGGSPNSYNYCACTADSDCGSYKCGLAMNASPSQYTRVCGTHIGWWTIDQLCSSSTDSSLSSLINCSATVTNSDGSTSTYTNLFACTKPASAANPEQAQSCYTSGAVSDCCGCATSADSSYKDYWPTVLNPGYSSGCYNNNSSWDTIVQPWLVYLKQACPTAYTYPFDDATSTFTCTGSAAVGAPNYAITFSTTK